MARVNIEESCFGERRLARFMALMGWDKRKAIGCLVLLWHDSQELLRVDGSAAEIVEWCWPEDPAESEIIVMALATAGYITPQDDGHFLIRGNQVQIENRVKKMGAAAKGGAATKERWERQKAKSLKIPERDSHMAGHMAGHNPLSARPYARPNAVQGNAMQCKEGGSPPLPFDLEMADEWGDHGVSLSPTLKPNREKNADAIAKLRKDGLTEQDVRDLLAWVKASDFWRDKVLSPVGLFKRRDPGGPRKLDTIRAQMAKTAQAPKPRGQGYKILTQADLDDL